MKQFEMRINLIVNYFLYNLEKTLLKIKKFRLHLQKLVKGSSHISIEKSPRQSNPLIPAKQRSNFKKTSITSENLFTEERLDKNFGVSPTPKATVSPRADPSQIRELENHLTAFEAVIQSVDFYKTLLLYSIEAVYFILNIQSVTWERAAELVKISHIQVWFLNFSYIEFETHVPSPLKKHFLQVENYLISHLVWKGEASIYKWYKKYELMASNRSLYSSPPMEDTSLESTIKGIFRGSQFVLFFLIPASPYIQTQPLLSQPEIRIQEIQTLDHLSHRLLHFIMLEINQIGEALKLSNLVKESVWELMKHIFLKVVLIRQNTFL